jgi:hypothetical protein
MKKFVSVHEAAIGRSAAPTVRLRVRYEGYSCRAYQ